MFLFLIICSELSPKRDETENSKETKQYKKKCLISYFLLETQPKCSLCDHTEKPEIEQNFSNIFGNISQNEKLLFLSLLDPSKYMVRKKEQISTINPPPLPPPCTNPPNKPQTTRSVSHSPRRREFTQEEWEFDGIYDLFHSEQSDSFLLEIKSAIIWTTAITLSLPPTTSHFPTYLFSLSNIYGTYGIGSQYSKRIGSEGKYDCGLELSPTGHIPSDRPTRLHPTQGFSSLSSLHLINFLNFSLISMSLLSQPDSLRNTFHLFAPWQDLRNFTYSTLFLTWLLISSLKSIPLSNGNNQTTHYLFQKTIEILRNGIIEEYQKNCDNESEKKRIPRLFESLEELETYERWIEETFFSKVYRLKPFKKHPTTTENTS